MSNKPAAMLANYTHAEFKPGLKVCRIVLEIPQEKRKEFFDAFGYPDPANPVPVAIARLDPTAVSQSSSAPERAAEGPSSATAAIAVVSPQEMRETRKPRLEEMTRAQHAGFLCKQKAFQEWAARRLGAGVLATEETAAHYVRTQCGVESRSDLNSTAEPYKHAADRWDRLRDTYIVESKWGVS